MTAMMTTPRLEQACRVAARLGPLADRAVRATELADIHAPSYSVVVDGYDLALLVACVHALQQQMARQP